MELVVVLGRFDGGGCHTSATLQLIPKQNDSSYTAISSKQSQ